MKKEKFLSAVYLIIKNENEDIYCKEDKILNYGLDF